MKSYLNKLIVICTILLLSASCEKDAVFTTLKEVKFSAPIQATPSTIVLTAANLNKSVETISWEAVQYPIDAPVTYALQFDILADTFGDKAWANAIRVEVGEDVLSKSLLGTNLNDMATKLGILPDVTGTLVVRVEAYLDHKIYSEVINLTVTPYLSQIIYPEIYMPGGYQGWDNATAATLPAITPGVYQSFITFPDTQSKDFNFITDRTGAKFYGGGNGNLVEGGTTNPTVPAFGSYKMNVNLNTLTYTAVPYAWGIIGTATAGGWNSSTVMTYDNQLKVWKFSGPLIAGALKFRLNDAWTINYGPKNSTEGIMYKDNPGAHDISEAGNYEIRFSINDGALLDILVANYPATATYTVTKI